MAQLIKNTVLTETLVLSESTDGYWLYDYTRGMNLAMRAATPQDAFVKALSFYQSRLSAVERKHASLFKLVERFVENVEALES